MTFRKLMVLGGLIGSLSVPSFALAATVDGVLNNSEGRPVGIQQVHFENRVTGDVFLVKTRADGTFSADLPPGIYDLREERGPFITSGVRVGAAAIKLGTLTELHPSHLMRWFEREGVAPAIVESPAPSTANIAVSASKSAKEAEHSQAAASAPASATAPAAPQTQAEAAPEAAEKSALNVAPAAHNEPAAGEDLDSADEADSAAAKLAPSDIE